MKAGDTVFHRTFGVGTIRELRKMGREAFVVFEGGFSLPITTLQLLELSQLNVNVKIPKTNTTPKKQDEEIGNKNPQPESEAGSLPPIDNERLESISNQPDKPVGNVDTSPKIRFSQPKVTDTQFSPQNFSYNERFRARQIIEALRLGIVPSFRVEEITVGRDKERRSIEEAFDKAATEGRGEVRAVVGEYGTGKSHLFEWATNEALHRNFLVARTSLDVDEVPPNKPLKIYSSLIRSLMFPRRSDGGNLAPLFSQFTAEKKFRAVEKEMPECTWLWRPLTEPLTAALAGYRRNLINDNEENLNTVLDWIAGENLRMPSVKQACGARQIAKMSAGQTAADLYCFLLSGISWLARRANYAGLVVLLDESEHYSLLNKLQKNRADTFFQGMIYSALQNRQNKVPHCNTLRHNFRCGLRHHDASPFPFFYAKDCGLIFMFAVTQTDESLNYDSWLDKERIIYLDDFLSAAEIRILLSQIQSLHAAAFNYEPNGKTDAIKEKLISRYQSGLSNLRELIKTAVEACDLAYQYSDFDPVAEV